MIEKKNRYEKMVEEQKQMRKDDLRRWQKNVKKLRICYLFFIREGHEEVRTKNNPKEKYI